MGHSFCCVETWIFRKVDHTYWKVLKCGAGKGWRGLFRTGLVINAEVLKSKEGQKYSKKKNKQAKSNDQILHGNCLLKRIIEGKIERIT